MHTTHIERFVVFQVQDEWLVTHQDRTRISYSTREEAETSAFNAADAMASQGHTVSVLIVPNEPDADGQHAMVMTGRTPRVKPN